MNSSAVRNSYCTPFCSPGRIGRVVDDIAIVKSIIFLAHSLRLNVVAEGVETEEQAAILLELGCDEMQGYLISRPVPPERVPELLRNQMQWAHDNLTRKDPAIKKKSRVGKKAKRR